MSRAIAVLGACVALTMVTPAAARSVIPHATFEQAYAGVGHLAAQPEWQYVTVRFALTRRDCEKYGAWWLCTVRIRITRPRDLATRCKITEMVNRRGYWFEATGPCRNGSIIVADHLHGSVEGPTF